MCVYTYMFFESQEAPYAPDSKTYRPQGIEEEEGVLDGSRCAAHYVSLF